jgi:hypothetical protein
MKNLIYIGFIYIIIVGCTTSKNSNGNNFSKDTKSSVNDTVRIANDELEYEVIIIDPGFNSWFQSYGKPRNFYSQNYLEARNRDWVIGWNNQFYQGSRLIDLSIDYDRNINYGYEVNYMLFNYLTYFQLTNKIKLGSFAPRI